MAANTQPIFKIALDAGGVQFTSADTTTKKTLITGNTGGNNAGTLVESINVCSNDTAAVNLAFYVNDGSTDFYIGNVAIPIGAGYTTVVLVEALRTLRPDLGFLTVKAGHVVKVNCVATMTAAKTVDICWQGGSY